MENLRRSKGDVSWFIHDRFGLFIHWGLYALAARHEWVKQREEIPEEKYDIYFRHFNPDLYDPELWARLAANAGMKYFVVTTKHHEGFCLWDSQYTDYKAPRTLAGRDLLKPMVEAFRKQGLRVGFYHSLIDWHHPDFVIDDLHVLRNHPDREKLNEKRNQQRYIEYLHNQVRELLTRFGQVDIFWFDFSYPARQAGRPTSWVGKGREDWNSEELVKLVRNLQPKILLNDRLDWPEDWDIKTPEQTMPREWVRVDGVPVVWEACHTFSGSWGYHRDEASWKSLEQLIGLLIEAVSKGGNFLLNVGPTGRGEFDERAVSRLEGIGNWMRRHSRSIYGCTQAPAEFTAPANCRLTYNPKTNCLYVHILAWPFRHLHLDGYGQRVEYAQLLHDASEVKIDRNQKKPEDITLELPVVKPNVTIPVVELFLK
ncbi:MAG: alpha-L-fucosidase [Candidatus Omnitrophica bacterium]|nr:alpha-L-fucosidase [Candidatus Omnitrophota bacterium]